MKQKTFFTAFEGLSFDEKNINLIKNGGQKLLTYMCPQARTLQLHHKPPLTHQQTSLFLNPGMTAIKQ